MDNKDELYQREETEAAQSCPTRAQLYYNNEAKYDRKQLSSATCWLRRLLHCISSSKSTVVNARLCLHFGMEMVWLLFNFIHDDRDANWLLPLFNAMLPYDRAFDHINYFRWGTVYLTDTKMLEEVAPPVHRKFTKNSQHHHPSHRSILSH